MFSLQQNNARASHVLLRLRSKDVRYEQLVALIQELESLVRNMILQIQLCEEILRSGFNKSYDVIVVKFSLTCDSCLENGRYSGPERIQNPSSTLIPNESWAIQIEGLTTLVASATQDLRMFSTPRYAAERLIRTLARLGTVIARQRRHIDKISRRQAPKIELNYDLNGASCPECGQPYPETMNY